MTPLQLEDQNIGKPTSPNVKILTEGEDYDYSKPYAIDNGYGEWLYNWSGAMEECKHIGKRMPTDDEWEQLIKRKSDMKNNTLAGYCNGGSCYSRGYYALYWSSSESGPSAWRRYFHYSFDSVSRVTAAQSYANSVRCIKES